MIHKVFSTFLIGLLVGALSIPTAAYSQMSSLGTSGDQDQSQKSKLSIRKFGSFNSDQSQSENLFLIDISVAGAVMAAGTYRLPVTARLTEALQAAGGLNPSGSLRRIEIRHGKKVRPADLWKFDVYGELSQNPYLSSGDLVFVPLRHGAIQVTGAVRRPGPQELINGQISIEEALKNAGDFAVDFAKEEPFRIIRLGEKGKVLRKIGTYSADNATMSKEVLINGDILVVPSLELKEEEVNYSTSATPGTQLFLPTAEQSVYLVGGFNRPGAYPYSPSLESQRYLAMAGGLNTMAKPGQTYRLRPDGTKQPVNVETSFEIQPGDTLVVPQKSIPPQFWPSFILSVASFALTVFLAVDRLKN